MLDDDLVAAIQQSKILQTGYTSDLLKTTFSYKNGQDEYILSLKEDIKAIYVYTKELQLFHIIELSSLENDESVAAFDVSPTIGNIVLVTNKGNILMYSYISLLNSWKFLFTKKHVISELTCVKWISEYELFVCDSNNIYVYLVKDYESFVKLWEQKTPGNPIFCIEKNNNSNYYSCLTFNSELVYIWKRTLIDLDNEIFDYKLILFKENGISTMNSWSHLSDNTSILYSLNTKKQLNIWTCIGEFKRYKTFDLDEKEHRFALIIPCNKKCGRNFDSIITFGNDFDKPCMIYKIEYNQNNLKVTQSERILNLKNIFVYGLSDEDFLYFNSIYNETLDNATIVCDNLNKKTSIHFEVDLKGLMDNLQYELFGKIAVFSGDVNSSKIIPFVNVEDKFLTKSLDGNITQWSIGDDHILKVGKYDIKSDVKMVLNIEKSNIYMTNKMIYSDNLKVDLQKENPKSMHLDKNNLFLIYSDQVNVYTLVDLKLVDSKTVDNSEWIVAYKNNFTFVSKKGNLNYFTYENNVWVNQKAININYEIEELYSYSYNQKFMFKNSVSELIIYDLVEMFIYYKVTVDPAYKNCSWFLLDSGEPIILLNMGTKLSIFYRDNSYEVINKFPIESIHAIHKNIIFQYETHLESLKISLFDEFLKPSQTLEYTILQLLKVGKYEVAKKICKKLDEEIASVTNSDINENKILSDISQSDLINDEIHIDDQEWKEISNRLLIKLDGDETNKKILKLIKFLQTNVKSNNFFVNNFNLALNFNTINFKDVIPLLYYQNELSGINGCDLDDINSASDMYDKKLTIWEPKDTVYKVFDKLSKIEYQATKIPHDVGIFYLSMGKIDSYKLLWKLSALKEATKIAKFLGKYDSKKCLNNGYKLLSLHRYKEACWFFLLGQDYKSMFYTAFKRMDSLELAIGSIRLMDEENEKLKECLKIYCIDYFYDSKMFWEWIYCGLIINDFDLEFVDISSFCLQLDDLLVLLSIFQKFGSVEKEKQLAVKVALMYQRLGDHIFSEYYGKNYVPYEKDKVKFNNKNMTYIKKVEKKSMFDIFNTEQSGSIKEDINKNNLVEQEANHSEQLKPSLLDDYESNTIEPSLQEKSLFNEFKSEPSSTKKQQPQQTKSLLDDWM
ncbi:hypothetical protein ACO0SA_002858 [Hanseniaspora valbyensis]